MANKKKYYKILDVSTDADVEDIKKAYRELAKKYHPDTTTDETQKKELEDKFKDLNEAYAVLSDPVKKENYDAFGTVRGSHINGPDLNDFIRQHFERNFGFAGHNPFFNFEQTISTEKEISYYQMICGGEIEIENTPVGKIKLNLPEHGFPGATFKVRINKDTNSQLFLQVTLNLKMPANLTPEQKEKIKELGI